ncbi:MAG: hypothetical protein A3J40_05160 [Erythrobacter sp. RIFCSPHIGHO2_12_FULL_63_10]|nr:MAG: hypothetical protein A3J40_05160 [Erythrobacter sp. RIFCSPHIGHO2_12_FULL_63_10]
MPESGKPIDRPAVYRTLIMAFAVWAAHFIVAYGAVLVLPDQAAARWVAIGGSFFAATALAVAVARYRAKIGPIGHAAAALAVAAIVFGTLPAIVG